MNISTVTEGNIRYQVIKRDGGGWDIEFVEVKGRSVLEPRKGEFQTKDEAKRVALEKGRAFSKLHGLD